MRHCGPSSSLNSIHGDSDFAIRRKIPHSFLSVFLGPNSVSIFDVEIFLLQIQGIRRLRIRFDLMRNMLLHSIFRHIS